MELLNVLLALLSKIDFRLDMLLNSKKEHLGISAF